MVTQQPVPEEQAREEAISPLTNVPSLATSFEDCHAASFGSPTQRIRAMLKETPQRWQTTYSPVNICEDQRQAGA